MNTSCPVCNKDIVDSVVKCARCDQQYCSGKCKKSHRKTHKKICELNQMSVVLNEVLVGDKEEAFIMRPDVQDLLFHDITGQDFEAIRTVSGELVPIPHINRLTHLMGLFFERNKAGFSAAIAMSPVARYDGSFAVLFNNNEEFADFYLNDLVHKLKWMEFPDGAPESVVNTTKTTGMVFIRLLLCHPDNGYIYDRFIRLGHL